MSSSRLSTRALEPSVDVLPIVRKHADLIDLVRPTITDDLGESVESTLQFVYVVFDGLGEWLDVCEVVSSRQKRVFVIRRATQSLHRPSRATAATRVAV